MIPTTNYWLRRLGFHVWHVPGVSRAWRFELGDGGYVLVTDVDGFDLPYVNGPYAAVAMSSDDEMLDSQPWLGDTNELFHWFEYSLPLYARPTSQFHRASEAIHAFQRREEMRNQMRSCLFPR